jgi:PAS domain S-box-containing protein
MQIAPNSVTMDSITGISRDVTEIGHNSRKWQESETRFRSLIENSTDIIIVIDNTGNIVYGSPSIEKHFGTALTELAGASAFNYIYPDDIPELTEKFFEVLNSPGVSIPVQSRAYAKDNRMIWVEGIVTNMLATEGVNGIVCNFRDVSERKNTERLIEESEVLRHQLMEEKINRQKEIMQAAIEAQERERAHIGRELHDNVKQILSTAKVCLEYGRENVAAEHHMIRRAEDMINTAIAELRELSKSLIQVYEREIGLQLSIENLLESVRIGGRFNIWVNFCLPDENKLDDKLKMTLFRIIQEQLSNILTHAEAANITITVHQQGGALSLSVEDDGKGFDVHQKRMGIGITNIINRAEIFNGQVDIHSAPGQGCRIQVNFNI